MTKTKNDGGIFGLKPQSAGKKEQKEAPKTKPAEKKQDKPEEKKGPSRFWDKFRGKKKNNGEAAPSAKDRQQEQVKPKDKSKEQAKARPQAKPESQAKPEARSKSSSLENAQQKKAETSQEKKADSKKPRDAKPEKNGRRDGGSRRDKAPRRESSRRSPAKPRQEKSHLGITTPDKNGGRSGPRPEKVEPRKSEQRKPKPKPEPQPDLDEITLEDLPQELKQGVERAGWEELMPVQAKIIPYALAGKDVMVQARTGSGKTGAFVLPMLKSLDLSKDHCQALVLLPTRELAKQVENEAQTLFGDSGLRTVAVYGGVGYGQQIEAFKKGAHLVVGTPGRILDHLLKRNLSLDKLSVLIFDEADRMLSIGFYPDMKEVQRYLPKRVSASMYSATYPPHVQRLAEEFMYNPKFVCLSKSSVHVAEIEHIYYEVPGMGKERCLMRVIETENPANGIIFCNTKANVHFVAAVLQQFGYDADELSADLSQAKREQVLNRVRGGELRFLVATDVAARGIDIPELSHVFLYEPPEDTESYIHRVGRTGRAGASGVAVSLVDVMQKIELQRIATKYNIELLHRELPTDEDVQKAVGDRLLALLESRLRKRTPLQRERLQRFIPLAKGVAGDENLLDLVAMLLDETYQETLHAPAAPTGKPQKPKGGGGGGRRPNNRRRPRRR